MSWRDRVRSRWDARQQSRGQAGVVETRLVTVAYETFIERAAQAVWDVMTDAAASMRVDPEVRVEAVAGTGPGVGEQHTLTVLRDGHRSMSVSETTAWFPPVHCASVITGQGIVFVTRLWIEHTGAGCRVRWQDQFAVLASTTAAAEQELVDRAQAQGAWLAARYKQLLETGELD